ncbi:hypothetical protein H4S02_002738 [Coemansia sp. RSA 2611]|nr:hypothetical protein H4S02_002738 [Coemansia sp. RSA 2611]
MKTPLLFVKLPRHVVESLQTASPEDLKLVLGGKERITTGTLHVGDARHDVRYSGERGSAVPLLFQGSTTSPAGGSGWAQWTQRGKLVGKLTVLNKNKLQPQSHLGTTTAVSDVNSKAAAISQEPQATRVDVPKDTSPTQNMPVSATRSAPQKKPGIFRQNRELLRDKILHILAQGPAEETQILDQVKSPQNVVLEALSVLGQKTDGSWSLKPEKFKLVQIDSWQKYCVQDRLRVAANALKAFDVLGLPANDRDRVRVERLQQQLTRGPAQKQQPKSEPATAVSANAPGAPLANQAKESPAPKKKPVRSVIAPTLSKPLHPDAAKPTKRAHNAAGTGASAPPTATTASFESSTSMATTLTESISRPNRPAPLLAGKEQAPTPKEGSANGPPDSPSPHQPAASVPNTAVGNATHRMDRHQRNASSRDPRAFYEDTDYHPASDAEAEYRRKSRGQRPNSPTGSPRQAISRSHSRNSRSRKPHLSPRNGDGYERRQHKPVRSRPLHLQSLVSTSSHAPDPETGAAVSRVQERLAQEMNSRRIPVAKVRSRSSSDAAQQGVPRRPRGPSLSPIADLPGSPSPLPTPKIERAETIEDLERLQQLLVSSYSEYSQLRLQIDSRSAAFAPLATELTAAQSACTEAIAERQRSEAEREEGEEIPGDARTESSLGFAAITEKCAPDGSRLYWLETAGDVWLADSSDAIAGKQLGRDGQPCRTQRLLPEEARVLKATQAIAEQYSEMDGDDVRRWVRRYLHLHSQIEQMNQELNNAYQRILEGISAEYDAFRDTLGDSDVDAAVATAGDEPLSRILNIDMYRDEVVASHI